MDDGSDDGCLRFVVCRHLLYVFTVLGFDDTFFLYTCIIFRSLFIITDISSFYGLSSQSFEFLKPANIKTKKGKHV